MKKRIIPLVFAVLLACSTIFTSVFAAEIRSSSTLLGCPIKISAGNSAGEINISYDVVAKSLADSVGVSSIKIYEANGTCVETTIGTPSNGLVAYHVNHHRSTYTFNGVSGASYYAKVTVAAAIGSDYDSKTIVTDTIEAP